LLEGKGLVSIRISKHCGRTNDIVLTADGENTLAKGMAAWEEAQDSFREFLGEKRSNILFDLSQAVNACVLAL
jgi:DNA-binding MarR family transcriptional regulator